MFDLEAENNDMTQVRHIESGTIVVIWHGTNKYDVTMDVDHAIVAETRKWIAERAARLHML